METVVQRENRKQWNETLWETEQRNWKAKSTSICP